MTNRAPRVLWIMAAGLVLVAILVSSNLLIQLGPLRTSLTSDNPSTRATAEMTVLAARFFSGLLGLGLVGICLAWSRVAESSLFIRVMEHRVPEAEKARQSRVLNPTGIVAVGLGIVSLFYLFVIGNRLPADVRGLIGREDGILEQGTALLFLGAAGLGFAAVRYQRMALDQPATGQRRSRVWRMRWFALLGVFFFFACGEEISWGQRLFDFGTPAAIERLNVQQETNLHNMLGYLADHLFIAGVFVFGAVLPLLAARYGIWRRALHRAGVPLASQGLALGFLLASALHEWTVGALLAPAPLRIAEIREFVVGACFLLLMIEQLQGARQRAAEPDVLDASHGVVPAE